jgi:ATP-dependent DNA helicase RecG
MGLTAFANTAGGILIIGVEDGTKNVLGVSDPLKEEERLANLVSDRILPRLVPAIEIVTWRSLQLIVVEVYPSPNQPHYLKSLGLGAGAFVRVGSTNRCADAALVEKMRRMVRNETHDESPLPRIDSEVNDLRVASELFRSVRALDRAGLRALRALVPHLRRDQPRVAKQDGRACSCCRRTIDRQGGLCRVFARSSVVRGAYAGQGRFADSSAGRESGGRT